MSNQFNRTLDQKAQQHSSRDAAKKVAVVGIVLLIIGLIAWIAQLTAGLLATSGMNNVFVWGLMIAVFAFLVGFGAGSQLVGSALYLFGPEGSKPVARIAVVVGFSCVLAAAIAVLVDLGAIRNIFAMLLAPNLRSPLSWDMVALTLYLVVSVIQLLLLAFDKPVAKLFVVLAALAAILLQVVEGLLFSMQTAHAWWATPIMPIDFLAVAFVSGAALVLFIAEVKNANEATSRWLGRFLAIAIIVHLVLALADLVLVATEGTPAAAGVGAALQRYWLLYAIELVLPLLAAILLLAKRSPMVAAVLTIIGIFAHRLMLLYPAYGAPSLNLTLSGTDFTTGAYPVSTGRYLDAGNAFGTVTGYAPHAAEWFAALLPIGVALLAAAVVFVIMLKIGERGTSEQ